MYTRSLLTNLTARGDKTGQKLMKVLHTIHYDFGLSDIHQMEQVTLHF